MPATPTTIRTNSPYSQTASHNTKLYIDILCSPTESNLSRSGPLPSRPSLAFRPSRPLACSSSGTAHAHKVWVGTVPTKGRDGGGCARSELGNLLKACSFEWRTLPAPAVSWSPPATGSLGRVSSHPWARTAAPRQRWCPHRSDWSLLCPITVEKLKHVHSDFICFLTRPFS